MIHADCTCTSGSLLWHESHCAILVAQRERDAGQPCSTPGCILGLNHGGDRCNTFDPNGHP